MGAALFGDRITISGTVNKTGILLICVVATAAWSWNLFTRSPQTALPLLAVGGTGGFIVALVTIFKKAWSPLTAPMYALLEGLVLGSASAMLEIRFPGIAMQAVGLTFGRLVALLLAYRSGIIRATEKFKIGIVAATDGHCRHERFEQRLELRAEVEFLSSPLQQPAWIGRGFQRVPQV